MYVRSAIMEFQYITKIYYMQGHCKFFSEQLTLSQPDGQIMPTTVLRALPPLRFLELATALTLQT